MELTNARRRILATVGGLLLLGAVTLGLLLTIGDNTTTVAADSRTGTTQTTAQPTSQATAQPTSRATAPDSTLPSTTPPETIVVDDDAVEQDTGCRSSARRSSDPLCFDPTGLERRLIAELLDGAQLVRYAEPTDLDCAAGTLVAESDGSVLTVYDVPFAGGIRALPSSFGPTALIGSCEEWINWVAFYDEYSGSSPAPVITSFPLPDDVFFLWDFAWVGLTGYLGAAASFSDGASPATTAAVVIDPADGSVELADDVFGARSLRAADGFDVLIADGWELVESDPAIEIRLPESGSRVRAEAAPLSMGPGARANEYETVDSIVDIDITVWGDIDGVRPSSWATGTETRFVSPDSTRHVRSIELDDRFVTIEAEIPAGASRGEALFILYLLDQVRLFDTVG